MIQKLAIAFVAAGMALPLYECGSTLSDSYRRICDRQAVAERYVKEKYPEIDNEHPCPRGYHPTNILERFLDLSTRERKYLDLSNTGYASGGRKHTKLENGQYCASFDF